MIEIFEKNIPWEKINIDKSQCKIEILKGTVSRETGAFTLHVLLDFIIPYENHLDIIDELKKKIGSETSVYIEYVYEKGVRNIHAVPELLTPYAINAVFDKARYIASSIDISGISVEDNKVLIPVLGKAVEENLNAGAKNSIEKYIKEKTGTEVDVIFVNNQKSCEDRKEQARAVDNKEMAEMEREISKQKKINVSNKNKANSDKSDGKKYSRGETEVVGNLIYGKKISIQPVALSGIGKDSGNVAVEGTVFKLDSRDTKNGNKIAMIYITDENTSIYIKCFMSHKKWEDLNDHIQIGSNVRIQGEAEFDPFERCVAINGRAIEKTAEKKVRQDNSEIKRVELHTHTKMSAMDGLSEPKEMVKLAAEFGHKAVAVTDHGVVQAFPDCAGAAKKAGIKMIYGVEGYLVEEISDAKGNIDYKSNKTNHIILLAKDNVGLKNLYKIVSLSHIKYFYRKPRITRALLEEYREGIIVGGACEAGEIYQAFLRGKTEAEKLSIAERYDYFEIQPLCNNKFLIDNGSVASEEELKNINKEIIEFGKKLGKLTVATCDAHYLEEKHDIYRTILQAGQGYQDIEGNKGLYFRTTEEMLSEFEYLGEDLAYEVVVKNTNIIADMIEEIKPVPDGKFPPKIEGADERLRDTCMKRVHAIYGETLPDIVKERLDKELNSIISNGYAVMYVSAEKLVQKSIKDGYLVGSRGSVGSSFAATMGGITEVNPLPAHYVCPDCCHSEFPAGYDCGVDMPDKNCPICGSKYKKDGFNIPFEVFLGFEGDKEPDIDLNFAGEYQPVAHRYVEEMFGKDNVFRAGTIGTIAQKTAFGFVAKYCEESNRVLNRFEMERIAGCCVGVRRTTGQHPGGIIIVPDGHEIYEFCPIQRPANDSSTDIITTHFDYHSIDQNLLKLDILGHDVPSMIRHLQDLTDIDPLSVPLSDDRVTSIFNGISGLDIKDKDYKFKHGSYGIPEFGTKFVRQMLDDTKPQNFADLIRISGFSHGTDVWLNNAQEFLKNETATMKEVISTRDDIMLYLIDKHVPNKQAFKIMESVRKGKGLTEEQEAEMRSHDVPEWYIESCKRIQYMFPKAHAVAYVMMAYRIAYYKVYYPVEFYAVIFTTKIASFDTETILKGQKAVEDKLYELENYPEKLTQKQVDQVVVYELAYEMYARGFEFMPPDIDISEAMRFTKRDGKVLLPLGALEGVGENAAKAIKEELNKREFCSVEDMRIRCKLNKNAIEALMESNAAGGLPTTNQISMF